MGKMAMSGRQRVDLAIAVADRGRDNLEAVVAKALARAHFDQTSKAEIRDFSSGLRRNYDCGRAGQLVERGAVEMIGVVMADEYGLSRG